MGKLTIVDPARGNTEIVWHVDNKNEVEAAKRVFEEQMSRGYKAFRYGAPKTEEIETFDQDAQEIFIVRSLAVLHPPVPGG